MDHSPSRILLGTLCYLYEQKIPDYMYFKAPKLILSKSNPSDKIYVYSKVASKKFHLKAVTL